jgi:hypothetical protein
MVFYATFKNVCSSIEIDVKEVEGVDLKNKK